jgi:hypothetical protein
MAGLKLVAVLLTVAGSAASGQTLTNAGFDADPPEYPLEYAYKIPAGWEAEGESLRLELEMF